MSEFLAVFALLNMALLVFNIQSAHRLRRRWEQFRREWAEYTEEFNKLMETRTLLELREIEARVLVEMLRDRWGL